jgi:hypothetical protein
MGRLRDYIRQNQVNKLRADARAEREPLPDGKYRLELVNGVLVETADEDVLELEWKVENGDHAGRRVYQRLKLAGPALAYSIMDVDLVGIDLGKLDSRTLPQLPGDLNRPGDRYRAPVPVGLVVGALIGHWDGNDGKTRHRIERLVKVLKPAPDLTDFEPTPPTTTTATSTSAATTAKPDEDDDEDDAGIEWDDEDGDDGNTEIPF